MNKKIIVIAEIVFALIFVVILAVIMSTVTSKGNSANTKLVDTLEMTDNSSANSYVDGVKYKGEAIKTAISQVKTIGGDYKIEIIVVTLANDTSSYDESHPYTETDTTKPNYINPSAEFNCTKQYNNNDVLKSITFTQISKKAVVN